MIMDMARRDEDYDDDEPQNLDRLLTDAGVVPWAPGNRNLLIQITPAKVTGRTVSAR